MRFNRRGFLGQAGLFAAAGVSSAVGQVTGNGASSADRPRRIIHMVADGMSMATLTCGDSFSRLLRGKGLRWLELARQPESVVAWMDMRSLNSLVTDSAAASSSWGSGSRVKNGSLNILPDGRKLKTLYAVLAEAGWKRGLVTTTEITHATPAGFAANVLDRGTGPVIAEQYLERGIEVLLGGGVKFFDPKKRSDKRDLYADYRAKGYQVMKSRDELLSASNDRTWLGTFSESHLPFTLDRRESEKLQKEVPTLAEMTRAALANLSRADRFVLQVEGGRVDHGAHACDAAAAFHDLVAFDEAVALCLDFQQQQPETLVVITTDHGTGNPGLNGTGGSYEKSSPAFARLLAVRRSFAEMNKQLTKATSLEQIGDILDAGTGYRAPKDKLKMFAPFLQKKGKTLYDGMKSPEAQLGQLLANYCAVGWVGTAHSSDYVPLTALGPGAKQFHGFLPNTDVFRHYLGFAKVNFENPQVPLLAESSPSAQEAERNAEIV